MNVLQWINLSFSLGILGLAAYQWFKYDKFERFKLFAPIAWSLHVAIFYISLYFGIVGSGTDLRILWSSALRLHNLILVLAGIIIYIPTKKQ
jgi:hypothetical protein